MAAAPARRVWLLENETALHQTVGSLWDCRSGHPSVRSDRSRVFGCGGIRGVLQICVSSFVGADRSNRVRERMAVSLRCRLDSCGRGNRGPLCLVDSDSCLCSQALVSRSRASPLGANGTPERGAESSLARGAPAPGGCSGSRARPGTTTSRSVRRRLFPTTAPVSGGAEPCSVSRRSRRALVLSPRSKRERGSGDGE